MTIFDFTDYRKYLRAFLDTQPKMGHGVLSQWAKELRVSTTLVSQVLAGRKKLSLELADGLAELIGLTKKEMEYLFLLVDFDRAGTVRLRKHFKQKIAEAQESSRRLKNRIEDASELSLEVKAEYYSTWLYSGLRNLVACRKMDSLTALSDRLRIPQPVIAQLLEFLMQNGLVFERETGSSHNQGSAPGWVVSQRSTYISSESPLVKKHHQNWRIRAIQKMDEGLKEDLFYTSPMSLSEPTARHLRKFLVDKIQELHKAAGPSESETVRCLNIDWFEF